MTVYQTLEDILVTFDSCEMRNYLKKHPEYFEAVIRLAVSDNQPLSWRAAWMLKYSIEQNDIRLQQYIKEIINALPSKKSGHQRELLNILYQLDIPEKHEGTLFDVCVTIWETITQQPSLRITAFKIIMKSVKKYPELAREILFLTEERYLETLSPGIKRALLNTVSELRKETQDKKG
jgi:hypothetical protein